VLLKQGVGVMEVKQAHFNSVVADGMDSVVTAEIDSDATNVDGAIATRLATGLKSLGAASEGDVETLNKAFATWFKANAKDGQADVTALLGANTDFESAQGDALSTLTQVHSQPGWNVHVASFTNAINAQYIHLRQRTDDGAPTTTSLYLRAKWQDQTASDQIVKQAALPAGTYTLTMNIKRIGTLTKNLCYYEIGGKRKLIIPTTSWVKRTFTLKVSEPSMLTLSFGFQGGVGSTESGVSLDDIQLVCTAAGGPTDIDTGIGTLKSQTATTDEGTYNVAGQRVDAHYKGIVIRKGKKKLQR
jgi:hypothetical protein